MSQVGGPGPSQVEVRPGPSPVVERGLRSSGRPGRRPPIAAASCLEIGWELLETRPIHELALDEVAAAAGVSRTLVFHYFPSKADFYASVVAAAGERLLVNEVGRGDRHRRTAARHGRGLPQAGRPQPLGVREPRTGGLWRGPAGC